jgi:hypothetical protein
MRWRTELFGAERLHMKSLDIKRVGDIFGRRVTLFVIAAGLVAMATLLRHSVMFFPVGNF